MYLSWLLIFVNCAMKTQNIGVTIFGIVYTISGTMKYLIMAVCKNNIWTCSVIKRPFAACKHNLKPTILHSDF